MNLKIFLTKKIAKLMEIDLGASRLIVILLCLFLVLAVHYLVIATGGSKYVFSHAMYVPILIAALVYGAKGGGGVALIGGFALGPFVPIDTITLEPQLALNWGIRMGFFFLIGSSIGLASEGIRFYISQLKWASSHDSATELGNRFSLESEIESLKRLNAKNPVHYLVMIQLENIREIERSCDPAVVSGLVKQIAFRAQSLVPAGLKIFSLTNGEISMLLGGEINIDIRKFCFSLRKYFQEPFVLDDLRLHCDIQLGVVKFNAVELPPYVYIQQASAVVGRSRESNASVVVFDMDHDEVKAHDDIELLGSIKSALDGKQLQMYFQPKVSLSSGKIEHVEALMRWKHPAMGDIPPGKFIPRAERSTLIDRLTEFAIDRSLSEVIILREKGVNIKVAVNISVRNLAQPRFVYQVLSLLDKYELDGSYLEFELTENSLMQNVENAIRILNKLSKRGVVISIDDFGTGYSSLQYLHRLPVSIIKIDQSFIKNIGVNNEAVHIVGATIDLAHRLGMKVIAEGVEDLESLHILKDMGCDMAQGYLIARPCSPEEFGSWYLKCGGVYQIESRV